MTTNLIIKFNGLISKVGNDYCIGFPALPDPILLTANGGLDDDFKNKIVMALTEYFEANTILEKELNRARENIDTHDNQDGDVLGVISCEMEKTSIGKVTIKLGEFPS